MVADEENRLGRSLPIQALLILSLLKEHRRLNVRQLRELAHLDEYRVRSTVEKLTEASLIEAYGETLARFYTLSSKVY